MIKYIETSAGIIFTQHIVRITRCSDGCRISTVDGVVIGVTESYENVMHQVTYNRKPVSDK